MRSRPPAIILPSPRAGFALLNCARLARIPAITLEYSAKAPVLLSRYPRRKVLLDPREDRQGQLLEALERLRPEGGVLLPSTDSQVLLLSRNRDTLETDFGMCLPPPPLVETLIDKDREMEAVRAAGIPVPATEVPPPDPRALIERLGPDIILKPRLPKTNYGQKTFSAHGLAELEAVYARVEGRLDGLVAQAFVPGGPETLWLCTCVFGRDHEMLSLFVYRKLRTRPVRNGVTVAAVSGWSPELEARARALGKALRLVGPADFEFKRDPRTGEYVYIETNPRFTLACEFAARCGVNQVEQAWRLAQGLPVEPSGRPREGVYFVDFAGDARARRQAGEAWPRIAWDALKLLPRRRVGGMAFTLRDPRPGLFRLLAFARWMAAGLTRRARGWVTRD
jgi:predicted ATP-grasp superfamily ATP-dependent carboligase